MVAEKIGLGSVDSWALFESGPSRESHIPGYQYLYDMMSSWEVEQVQSVVKAKLSPAKGQTGGQSGGGAVITGLFSRIGCIETPGRYLVTRWR